mmetsp:Transcript_70025/g.114953  ORF Transcript_70025/g.114953 Transcript_70025/m.114953 type:complete len:307 (-) Transcript_70025:7-927(-)
MDGPLPLHPQGSTPIALGAVAIGVRDVAEGAVNGSQAIGPRSHHDAGHGVVPGVTPDEVAWLVTVLVGEHPVEFVGASDVRGAALGRRAVICHAEVQRFVALGGGGDGVDVHHAHGCFDDEAEAQLLLSSHGGLHLTHEGIGHVDVLVHTHHGDDENIASFSRLLDDVHHIAVHVVTIEAIDTDGHRLVAKVHFLQCLDHILSSHLLFSNGHRIFQVHHYHVGRRLGCLWDDLGLGARHIQLTAVQSRSGLLHHREAVPQSSSNWCSHTASTSEALSNSGQHLLGALEASGRLCRVPLVEFLDQKT